mmetsp:Transcript_23175/g.54803  ORF Transcript_23175/g.54803 Transcript_23175/m.54803 type:complete len:167 (+) Transcript_23175:118-618(+)|eukprot:CAMPEP_0197183244 /NCGR_PEP_ID=MMETSP1423-20130617/7713_1 /TAXON_ID=476441 /ORGANISM="Pseudo-nitzschia heimii, Strain UNC1101" /LENGTH=166 /DNA_ID=CAMNT_0042633805 /DNA_START=87 /DNA_END=587 /DNA_ORIENTATION=-
MIAITEKNTLFDSSSVHLRVNQPLHKNVEELEKPTIDVTDEETSNPVLKKVIHDLRRAQMNFGYHHEKCAEAWNALGLVRIHMQRDAESARKCHEYALAIFRDHDMTLETATTLNDLGYCHERLDLPVAALENYEESLDILEVEDLPENHPQVLCTKRALSRMTRK